VLAEVVRAQRNWASKVQMVVTKSEEDTRDPEVVSMTWCSEVQITSILQ